MKQAFRIWGKRKKDILAVVKDVQTLDVLVL